MTTMLGFCGCDAGVCEQWTVCDVCHRPIPAFRAAIAVKTSEILVATLDPVVHYAEVSRAKLEQTAFLARTGHRDAATAGSALLDHISTHFMFENLGKSALYLTMALGAETMMNWLDRELTAASELVACAECAADLDEDLVQGLGQQLAESSFGRLKEIATAALVVALAMGRGPLFPTTGGISSVRRAISWAKSASRCCGQTQLGPALTAARLIETGIPISCASFDPAVHGTGDLMLSALWCHRQGMAAEKDELMFTLAPSNDVSVALHDAAHWGAFDLAATPIWQSDHGPTPRNSADLSSQNHGIEQPQTFEFHA